MATYFIVSTLCSTILFFYNIKKRFTVKITYVLTFLITYILLNYAIHSETESNVYFGVMMAFPSLFVSLMFTNVLSEPLTAFHEGIKIIFELILEFKFYAAIIITLLIGVYFFLN